MKFCCAGTCTRCYVFITLFLHGTDLHQYCQSQPHEKNYIQEALDDSNMRQQCPKVEMWNEPPTKEDALVGTSPRRSSRKVDREATDTIRLLVDERGRNKRSRQHGAHKKPAISSPQLVEPSTSDPLYVPIPEPESSGTDESVTCLEGGEEVAPTTAHDTACGQEADRAPPTCAKLNKMCKKFSRSMATGSGVTGAPPKRNPKRRRVSIKENYNWVHPCLIIKDDNVTYKTTCKQIVLAIWATCRLRKFKSPDCRAYGVKTKPDNCPSWARCIKHVECIHYSLDKKDLEEVLIDPKAHWDSLEESKARKHGMETWYQGQSTLDDCVEEFWHRSAETKRCMANLKCLCVVEDLPLHMSAHAGFVKFMRQWDPRWPSISKQSMTMSVEEQSQALWADIKCKMLEIVAKTDIASTANFWTSPTSESFMTMSRHWIMRYWRLKMRILGPMHFPEKHTAPNIFERL